MVVDNSNLKCDDSVLDPVIKEHIISLYKAMDERDLVRWGNHFTEDTHFKKEATDVKGRDVLVEMSTRGWAAWKSRAHTVYAVYPLGPKAEEIMLHGRSNNEKTTGEKITFTWAARMHFQRSPDGKVLIDEYTIIPDYHR